MSLHSRPPISLFSKPLVTYSGSFGSLFASPEPCVPKQGGMDSAELLPQSNDTEVLAAGHRWAPSFIHLKRGCNLLTCMVHDLAYRINQTSKRMNSAPQEKISPQGYGRRRRRSLLHRSAPRSRGEARLGLAWLHTQRRSAPQTQT
uniref:Uncharacterized protein n=1 Tax=Electrophorus electricus TaxID=8005 RepID=A0A4W4F5W2_ELEEL